MPTLQTLLDHRQRDAALRRIAEVAHSARETEVELNDGFSTKEDLLAASNRGDAIDFDYDRLLKEAGKYE